MTYTFDYSWHPVCSYFRDSIGLIDATDDRSEVTCFLGGDEALLTLLRAAKSPITRIALLCSSGLHPNVVCERPGPCYRRAVFIGDELAVDRSPCSYAPDGQGAILAPVRQRGQPHPLGSIDQHEYRAYARRSEHFLFRPCVSA
jgi:hypothetical protein